MTSSGRGMGRYRFSERFLSITTGVLIGAMVLLLAAGITIGVISDGVDGETGDTLGTVGMVVAVSGLVLPLLVAAILGAEAIRRGGGVIGLLLVLGICSTVAGSSAGRNLLGDGWTPWAPLALWGGIGLMVLGTAGFWIIGRIARVPMWIRGTEANTVPDNA